MSKNTYLVLAMLCLFAAGLTFYYGSTVSTKEIAKRAVSEASSTQYVANDVGVTFDYLSGEGGYTVAQPTVEYVPSLEKLVVLSRENEDILANAAAVPLETSPTITLTVYKNAKLEQPSSWVNNHKMYSNIELKTVEPKALTIGGADAIRYTTDGLYRTDNVVIAHADYIYLFSGAYLSEDSAIHKDFLALLGTIEFIPTKEQI